MKWVLPCSSSCYWALYWLTGCMAGLSCPNEVLPPFRKWCGLGHKCVLAAVHFLMSERHHFQNGAVAFTHASAYICIQKSHFLLLSSSLSLHVFLGGLQFSTSSVSFYLSLSNLKMNQWVTSILKRR
jgi:hypothetical protein